MCEYCNFEVGEYQVKPLLDKEGRKSYLRLHEELDGRIAIEFEQVPQRDNVGIINYCPMCGRKLERDKANTEQ